MEPVRSIEFNDGPLFVYASEKKEESGRVGAARECEA